MSLFITIDQALREGISIRITPVRVTREIIIEVQMRDNLDLDLGHSHRFITEDIDGTLKQRRNHLATEIETAVECLKRESKIP